MSITSLIQATTVYIDTLVGGNEFASGIILGGLMGSLTYLARTIPRNIWSFTKKHVTTTMDLNSTQESFHYLLKYLFEKGLSSKSRSIKIGNGRWGEDDTMKEIGYGTHWFWYDNVPIQIDLKKDEAGAASNAIKEYMVVTKFGRSHDLFNKMILSIKEKAKNTNATAYYIGGVHKSWICAQPKRSLDSVILSKSNKAELCSQLDRFANSEDWFLKYNIPYQLGILLYGPPGTGKTSLIRAIAAYLDRDIVIVTDIADFAASSQRATNAVIVAEEIDTFGLAKRSEDTEQVNGPSNLVHDSSITTKKPELAEPDAGMSQFQSAYGKFSLGKVLNALDGVVSNHGRVIIMTSNKRDELDQALLRPGRIDLQLEISHFTTEMFKEFLQKFFTDVDLTNRQVLPKLSAATLQQEVIVGKSKEEIIDMYTKEVEA
ncbi:MAG: AAA family ATPase [Pelagibacterales bacterium]|nr:AAA family ATPase [Pelagibacterales bacterium]